MPQEISQLVLKGAESVLKLLGVTSLVSFLGLWTAWIAFPPELIIESVSDKSKKFNTESRVKVKNIGKLPASDIDFNITELVLRIPGIISISNSTSHGKKASSIHRLSSGESAENAITPGIIFTQAAQISEMSYVMTVEYTAKFLVLRKRYSKRWKIELRNFEDGYRWNWTSIK